MADNGWSDWIDWAGGKCPVHYKARVHIQFRDGNIDIVSRAGDWVGDGDFRYDLWEHEGKSCDHIVKYKVSRNDPYTRISDLEHKLKVAEEALGQAVEYADAASKVLHGDVAERSTSWRAALSLIRGEAK